MTVPFSFGSGPFGSGIFGAGFELADDDTPDNNYLIDLRVGSHVWSITSGDELDEDAGAQVLDGLRVTWSFPANQPWPNQPDPAQCRLGLLAVDVATFADLEIGTPVYVRAVDGVTGELLVSFVGRIADLGAGPVKRGEQHVTLYELQCVGFVVDLAELDIGPVSWPAEDSLSRLHHIAAEIARVDGREWGAMRRQPFVVPGDLPLVDVDALELKQPAKALTVLDQLLRSIAEPSPWERWIVVPVFGDDPLDQALEPTAFTAAPHVPQVVEPAVLPAHVELDAGQLVLVVDPDQGLPAGEIELASSWVKRKARAVTVSTATGPFGSVSIARSGPPVRQSVETILVDQLDGRHAARMYLPDVDTVAGWECELFTWRVQPDSQGKLTPLVVDELDPAPPLAYRLPVLVSPVPDPWNNSGDAGYVAGSLGGVTVTISRRRLVAAFQLRRRVALPTDDGSSDVASWDWALATFPTTSWDDIDPALTWYDMRLVRRT